MLRGYPAINLHAFRTTPRRAPSRLALFQPAASVGLLLPGTLVAIVIHILNEAYPDRPERVVELAGALFTILIAAPPVTYILLRRERSCPDTMIVIATASLCVVLVGAYLYWASAFVRFPADLLLWSESDFVNDIIKLRLDYPMYSDQRNNESFLYMPGAQVLTYVLAWLSGSPTSIQTYRAIQLLYVLFASLVASACCWKLLHATSSGAHVQHQSLWTAVFTAICFLVATNSLTNPFTHFLHTDALVLLLTIVAYWLLLQYNESPDRRVVALMVIIVPIGFLVKQSFAIWVALYGGYLAWCAPPRSIRHLCLFIVGAGAGLAAAVSACYLLWGNHFVYWIFTVLSKHSVSTWRAFEHALQAWPYLAGGLFAAIVLLGRKSVSHLLGPWLVWLALVLVETYSSGVHIFLHHLGPGSLIGAVWLLAALVALWQRGFRPGTGEPATQAWARACATVLVVALLAAGLGLVRLPLNPVPADAYRYLREIEREFEGESAADILMDIGSWQYLSAGVVMKDRVATFGDRGANGTGDFSGFLGRLEEQRYAKILVRSLHAPEFWYDHHLWSTSSNVRNVLLEHYSEIGRIPGVSGNGPGWTPPWIPAANGNSSVWSAPYGLRELSILVPNRSQRATESMVRSNP